MYFGFIDIAIKRVMMHLKINDCGSENQVINFVRP